MKLTDKELQMAKKAGLHVANKDAYSKATLGESLAMNESPFDGYSYNNITDELAKFAELIRADSVPDWISVDDKLPEIGVTVFLFDGCIVMGEYSTYEHQPIGTGEKWGLRTGFNAYNYGIDGDTGMCNATYWQPLPAAPKLKDKQ
jgi:hypothetical protein